jgi:hypothetical protein
MSYLMFAYFVKILNDIVKNIKQPADSQSVLLVLAFG